MTSRHGHRRFPRRRLNLLEGLEARTLLTTFNPMTAAAFTTALNNAQLGDTIILDADTTYVGQFTLPNKTTGSGWITIQSSRLNLLPTEGVRVTPADAVNMPNLQAPGNNAPVLRTPPGNPLADPIIPGSPSHHYKFIGIEFVGPKQEDPVTKVPEQQNLTALINLGTDTMAQSTIESVPHHLIFDRTYMRPYEPTAHIRRAFALNSAYTDIINSTIEEIHEPGSDSQAIGGWNGLGPYNIINNRLEGASENIMFGGATNRMPGRVASDIVIRGNHIIKPLHWRSLNYNVKNLFELKHGSNVLLEGNILENCWVQGQTGVAIVLKLGDYNVSPQNVTENVVIRNNIIRHANGAVALQGRDYASNSPEGLVRDISFVNNIFEDINGTWSDAGTGSGTFNIYLTHGPKNVTFDHNVFFNKGTLMEVDTNSATYENENFKFKNNIIGHGQYGLRSSIGTGNNTFNAYFTDAGHEFVKNVLVDVNYVYRNSYTARPNNFLIVSPNNDSDADGFTPDPQLWNNVGFTDMAGGNYRLAPASPYNNAATDGTDIGPDMDAIAHATAGALNGVWFAYQVLDRVYVNLGDGLPLPVELGSAAGLPVTAKKHVTTVSFTGVADILATGTPGDDILHIRGPVAPPLTFNNGNGHDEVRVLSGGHTFTSDLSPALRNVTVKVDSGATANFNSTQHLEKLNIDGSATLNAGGGKVLVTGEMNLGAAGKLDLKDNDLIVDYSTVSPVGTWTGSSYNGITGLVQSGRNGGAWDGARGIISSSAASRTTLGVAETKDFGILGTQTGTFFGQSVDSTSVLVKFTWAGDANLDGKINVDDYGRIDANVGQSGIVFGWIRGDFNYDGKINVDDYGIIDGTINQQDAIL